MRWQQVNISADNLSLALQVIQKDLLPYHQTAKEAPQQNRKNHDLFIHPFNFCFVSRKLNEVTFCYKTVCCKMINEPCSLLYRYNGF